MYLFIFCFVLLSSGPAEAQRSVLFLEGGGIAPYYSLNYGHRLFGTGQLHTYLRVGVGFWGENLAFPLGLSLIVGQDDHRLELTPAIGVHFDGPAFWDQARSDLILDLGLGLAYRWQPDGKAYFFSAGLFPYLRLDPTSKQLSERAAEAGLRPGLTIVKIL